MYFLHSAPTKHLSLFSCPRLEHRRDPDAELGAALGVDPVADGDDRIQVEKIHLVRFAVCGLIEDDGRGGGTSCCIGKGTSVTASISQLWITVFPVRPPHQVLR